MTIFSSSPFAGKYITVNMVYTIYTGQFLQTDTSSSLYYIKHSYFQDYINSNNQELAETLLNL